MKLAIFTDSYPPSVGGQEQRFAEMGQSLTEMGHTVSVFCVAHPPNAPLQEVIHGVEVFRMPAGTDYMSPFWSKLRRNPKTVLRYALWCRRIARENAFDCHIYNEWPLGHIVCAPRACRDKSVIDWCEIRNGLLFRIVQSVMPRMVGLNIAVSPAVKLHLEALSGRNVTYIPSGIFNKQYRDRDQHLRSGILYVGRIAPHKNLTLLLAGFKILRESGYQGRLMIAGSGPSLANVRDEVEARGLSDVVDLLGFVSDEQKTELLARAEVMVVPSKREGFPRVVAEAMASGLPVVTVRYPENGTKDVVDYYKIGVTADPTPEALVEALFTVRRSWSVYSRAGLKAAPALDWSVVCNNLLASIARH